MVRTALNGATRPDPGLGLSRDNSIVSLPSARASSVIGIVNVSAVSPFAKSMVPFVAV
jgi:hypothetical protein